MSEPNLYRIRVDGELTIPRHYATPEEADDAYRTLHSEHAATHGAYTLEEVAHVRLRDLLPDPHSEAYERLATMGADNSVCDALGADWWVLYAEALALTADDFERETGTDLDAVRVVGRQKMSVKRA